MNPESKTYLFKNIYNIVKKIIIAGCMILITFSGCKQSEESSEMQFITIENVNGPTLGYSPNSGVTILETDGLKFKDLNRNGLLDSYEDWRLSVDERAKDLAIKMSVEQIAGLMLYSPQQSLPALPMGGGPAEGTYDGKNFSESTARSWQLTDQQKVFLGQNNVRHVLIGAIESPATAALWNNEIQGFSEGIGLGIPCNTSSDPRHAATGNSEFNSGSGGAISLWPDGLGLAATFDPAVVKRFGEIAAREYRAMGITTALSPQIDLGTEPRWFRIFMTFGESPKLTTDLARAYIDGFQTSEGEAEIKAGWGYHSVNAMSKHWPGGGTVEAGRDAHWAFGKYGVYPGKNFESQLKPFVEGAFHLDGKTGQTAAIMPYYTISYNQAEDGTNYGNNFSKYIISDLLRGKYGFDGVVCTDWMVTADEGKRPGDFWGKPWGVEDKTEAERHYIGLMIGVDQFGGNSEVSPLLEAYQKGVSEHGEEFMRKRMEQSAIRLLRSIFRVGLFENPYLDPQESRKTVGNPEFMQAGYDAQLKSIVMLKNKNQTLPIREKKTVYIPQNYIPSVKDWYHNWTAAKLEYTVNMELVKKYYNVTENPSEADFAMVFVNSPYVNNDGGGYDFIDREKGGNGYVPISLQYGSYTATTAREHSIAAGDPVSDPEIKDRSYKGKSAIASNVTDLHTIITTRKQMGDKPVIVIVNVFRPLVFKEFESYADAILLRFNINEQPALDVVSGSYEPSGLLPLQMPADMKTVEVQNEDVPFDMECYKDEEGNTYDFSFGMNWSGVIQDARTEKYKRVN